MKLYAAVTKRSKTGNVQSAIRAGFANALISYAEGPAVVLDVIFECRRRGMGVFLDSGAFAAYTRGVAIPIRDYIAFCKRVEPLVDVIACLDVIGDPAATLRNERAMEDAGLEPLVTCHFGMRPEEVVERFRGRRRGALGGMAMRSRSGRELRARWLDGVFDALMKSDAWPIRLHGYGMTDTALIERYPWFSVDSTTWAMSAIYGNEMVADGRLLTQRVSPLYPQRGTAANMARAARTGPRVARIADYCTRLWEKRGIVWDN